MLLYFVLLCFCFATSIGFKFGPVTENATVGKPFPLTWILDKDDVPDELQLKQRLKTQDSGMGKPIPFSFPNNGTLNGTVMVTFEVSGDHLAEAFQEDKKDSIGGSNTISVGFEPESSTSSSTAYPTPVSSSSATSYTVTSVLSTSPSSSGGQGIPSTSSAMSAVSGGTNTDTTLLITTTDTSQLTISSTSRLNTPSTTTATNSAWPPSQPPSQPSFSPSSNSNVNMPSSAPGSPSKTLRIVGAAVGSFVFLLLLLAALIYTLRRRRWHRKQYPALFHRDRMVRKRSNASFSPLTPTAKDPETYTSSADVEKRASRSSTYKADLAPSPQPQEGCLEYSLPAPLAPRSETPSPIPTHTDRQMEISDVLVKKNTDLIRLRTELRRGGDVQGKIEGLKATIKGLEDALASPWAFGYTDEMPNKVPRALVPN